MSRRAQQGWRSGMAALTTRFGAAPRRVLWGLLTICAAVFASGALTRVLAEEWPHWGGPRGDETWRGPPIAEQWPASGLPRLWRQPLGGGYGGLATEAGRVYVQDRVTEPSEQERLLCLDAATGETRWTYAVPVEYGKLDYGNGPRATPTLHDGRVYALGALGHLACLEAATGKVIWRHELRETHQAAISTWGLSGSPVVYRDLLLVHVGGPGTCMVAFDLATGKERWRGGDDPAGYATPVVIDAPSGPLLICWTPEHIVGQLPTTGKVVWKIPYKITYGVSIATPIYREGLVFISGYWDGSKAIRLGHQPESAELAWEENRFLRGLMAQPIYRDGHVYTIDKQFGLTCFELQTAQKKWDCGHRVVERGRNPQASLTWIDDSGKALLFNENGDLILARLEPSGYNELTRAHLIDRRENAPIWAHPAYSGRRVFVRSDSELIACELPAP